MSREDPDGRRCLSATGTLRGRRVLFYPIDPGHEDESWQRFFEEGLPRFFAGTFAGEYMDAQLARLEAAPRAAAVETLGVINSGDTARACTCGRAVQLLPNVVLRPMVEIERQDRGTIRAANEQISRKNS